MYLKIKINFIFLILSEKWKFLQQCGKDPTGQLTVPADQLDRIIGQIIIISGPQAGYAIAVLLIRKLQEGL